MASWGRLITETMPLALVIALSPLSIIPAVMVLQSPRGKAAGLAYLVGWVLTLAALTAAFVLVSGLITDFDKPPKWASWVRIVAGAALIIFGIWRWFTRHKHSHTPKWMRQLTEATPKKAGITAAVLAVVNPKVVFICLAAGLAIGTEGLGTAAAWATVAWFVVVAASSVALPVLGFALSGGRLDAPLLRLKEWMEKHNAALMAAILIVIGLLVLYKGIHGLELSGTI